MLVINTRAGQTYRLDPAQADAWRPIIDTPEEITAIGIERGSIVTVLCRPKDFGPERVTFDVEHGQDPHMFTRVRMFVAEIELRVTLTGRRPSQGAVRVELTRPGWRRHGRGAHDSPSVLA